MFHSSSNRLSAFLEVSSLSISLAQSGGTQYKGGYLQIHATNNGGGGFGRKGISWQANKEIRWSAVRESYLAVVDEPGEVCFVNYIYRSTLTMANAGYCLGRFPF